MKQAIIEHLFQNRNRWKANLKIDKNKEYQYSYFECGVNVSEKETVEKVYQSNDMVEDID